MPNQKIAHGELNKTHELNDVQQSHQLCNNGLLTLL